MNDMTVGMENLPNVFIDRIMISPRVVSRVPLRVQHNIKVFVEMFDNATDPSWRNKVHGLKVKCSFVEDERIESLNSGEISLYDIPVGAVNRTLVESCDAFNFRNRMSGYETYSKVFEMNILQPNNMNVYVACFIDDLEFGIPQFDKFYGPMMAEKIYVDGIPNDITGYFYNPMTNEEYGGPVHQHSSGYMEGSMHRDEQHARLRFVEEENYKLTVVSNADNTVFAGIDLTRQPEENRTDLRPGYVDPDPDGRRFGPQTNIPDPEVEIEDPNLPTDIPTEIYE
tara:strand:- start:229 stop:1077 length:849 start_codon:yes stop_codon:yes gene_type:complete